MGRKNPITPEQFRERLNRIPRNLVKTNILDEDYPEVIQQEPIPQRKTRERKKTDYETPGSSANTDSQYQLNGVEQSVPQYQPDIPQKPLETITNDSTKIPESPLENITDAQVPEPIKTEYTPVEPVPEPAQTGSLERITSPEVSQTDLTDVTSYCGLWWKCQDVYFYKNEEERKGFSKEEAHCLAPQLKTASLNSFKTSRPQYVFVYHSTDFYVYINREGFVSLPKIKVKTSQPGEMRFFYGKTSRFEDILNRED